MTYNIHHQQFLLKVWFNYILIFMLFWILIKLVNIHYYNIDYQTTLSDITDHLTNVLFVWHELLTIHSFDHLKRGGWFTYLGIQKNGVWIIRLINDQKKLDRIIESFTSIDNTIDIDTPNYLRLKIKHILFGIEIRRVILIYTLFVI